MNYNEIGGGRNFTDEDMKFLGGLGLFLLGIIISIVAFRSKRHVHMGGHSSCLVAAFMIIGVITMVTEAWNWGSIPTSQVASVAQNPSSTPRPTPRPTQTITYRRATWNELVSFLSDDHTNWNEYIPGRYVCINYAIDLVENAHKQNIKSWIVGVDFYNTKESHAFTAFETSDRGIIYVEPQGDNTYSDLRVGQYLCDDWGIYGCWGKVESFEYLQCNHSGNCTPYTP